MVACVADGGLGERGFPVASNVSIPCYCRDIEKQKKKNTHTQEISLRDQDLTGLYKYTRFDLRPEKIIAEVFITWISYK